MKTGGMSKLLLRPWAGNGWGKASRFLMMATSTQDSFLEIVWR